MTREVTTSRRAALLIAACFTTQAVVALVVIPPWQNPDEPQHVMSVRQVMAYGPDFLVNVLEPSAERDIVSSMAQYGWWTHYGQPTPEPVPATFADGPAKVVRAYFGPPGGGSRLYYRSMAALFRATRIDGVLAQMYAMRILSAIFSMLMLAGIWRGTTVVLDEFSAVVITVAVALMPQFVLMSTTAGPDALVNLAGAAFWWSAAILLAEDVTWMRVAAVAGTALFAVLMRRMGAPLVIAAVGLIVAQLLSDIRRPGTRHRLAIAVGAAIVAIVALTLVLLRLVPVEVQRAATWIQFDPRQSMAGITGRVALLQSFLEALFTTFWLSAGWLRYVAPPWWYGVPLGISVASAAGVLWFASETVVERRAVCLAVAMAALQIAAIIAYYFGVLQSGPQGRYLFPALPAIAFLLWTGWRRWFDADRQRIAAAYLIAVMVFVNVTAWMLVIFPAYL